MVSLRMIVPGVFSQSPPQRFFTEEDKLGEAFLLYRAHPSLRKRVQIWAPGGKLYWLHSAILQRGAKGSAEFAVSIVQHVAALMQIPQAFLGRRPANLLHPYFIRPSRDSGNVHTPAP